MSVRVVVVDDQALIRAGLTALLSDEAGIDVVGEASDGTQALRTVRALRPDVVLMDVRMPGMDGLEATRRLVEAGLPSRVLVLTTFDLDEYVFAALRAGASGFLLKDAPAEQLIEGVRVVAAGEAMLTPSVTRQVVEEFARLPPLTDHLPVCLSQLTRREMDVLRLLAKGRSNPEIAAELVIAETTVKTHVAHVLMKLGLRDRVQAVVFAYESGLVRSGR
ncbi:MAG: response regulator transcription factor [Actinomycetota bacterium]|nr:response regulator transcription factor [Actinomycetota bacterium]